MSNLHRVGCTILDYNSPDSPLVTFLTPGPQEGDSHEVTLQKLLACCVDSTPPPVIDHESGFLIVWNHDGYGDELRQEIKQEDGIITAINYTYPDGTPYPLPVVDPSGDEKDRPVTLIYRIDGTASGEATAMIPIYPASGNSLGRATRQDIVPGKFLTIDFPRYSVKARYLRETSRDPGDGSVGILERNGVGYLPGSGGWYAEVGYTEMIDHDDGIFDFTDYLEAAGETYVEISVIVPKAVADTL